MRIQFVLEVYVHRQRLYKKMNSMVPFYVQGWHVSRFCATAGLKITNLSYMTLRKGALSCSVISKW